MSGAATSKTTWPADAQVGASAGGTSAEEVNLVNPAAGNYTVVVQGWGTDGPDAQFTLFKWLLGGTAAGNMTVTAPAEHEVPGLGRLLRYCRTAEPDDRARRPVRVTRLDSVEIHRPGEHPRGVFF